MFKSELLIFIFILVILAILYFNTSTTELFTFKKMTINKKENKQLIVDNLQRIIDSIKEYVIIDKNIKKLQEQINIKLNDKITKSKEIKNKSNEMNDLKRKKNIKEQENSNNIKLRFENTNKQIELNFNINVLKSNISKLNNDIIEIKEKEIKQVDLEIKEINKDLEIKFKKINEIRFINRVFLTKLRNEYDILIKKIRSLNKIKRQIEIKIKEINKNINLLHKEINDKTEKLNILNDNNKNLNINIDINLLELSTMNTNIKKYNNEISILNKEINELIKEIKELEIIKNQKIKERTNVFNDLNNQLISYELEELIEDLTILKKTQQHYELMLQEFKKTRKIEFGELKLKDGDYRKFNLIDNYLIDNDSQKKMYYKLTDTQLKNKLDKLCKITENKYCESGDYKKVCKLDIINDKITDTTNNTIIHNEECLKAKSFMNKLPYTITKK
jgi:hypothetical protein